jgi:glycosyltransferase involved in cell wall biosynthesis
MTNLVDATLVLRWGPQTPTGIPRIETAIVKAALERNSDETKLFCFDSSEKKYRLLRTDEYEFVRLSLTAGDRFAPSAAQRLSLRERLREVTALYTLNPSGSSETHRLIAQYLVAAPERSGLRYEIAKALVRVRLVIARGRGAVADGAADESATDTLLAGQENACLISLNTAYISEKHGKAEIPGGTITLIVYDTIALDHPEFAVINTDRFKSAFRRFVSAASTIVCISQATADSVRKWSQLLGVNLDGKAVRAMRLSSPLQTMRCAPMPVPELAGTRFVAYCSTIEPRKNHHFLLKVWSSLAREIGVENLPTLVLIGRWGWKYDAIEKMLRDDETLKQCVKHFPYLPDSQLIWVYQSAQYTVFPSVTEGLGLGAAESLDFGTPVVIAETAALREATHGLMPALRHDDEAGWISTIKELALSQEKLTALRRVAREDYDPRPGRDDWDDVLNAMGSGDERGTAMTSSAGAMA